MTQKKNMKKRRNQIVLFYIGKFLVFWLTVIGIFAIIRVSSSALAETLDETATVSGTLVEPMSTSMLEYIDITNELQVTIANWNYGELPNPPVGDKIVGSGIIVDSTRFTYTYEGMAKDGSTLVKGSAPPVKAGDYKLQAVYKDDTQMGSVQVDFQVLPKKVTPAIEVSGVTKPFDFTNKLIEPLPEIQFADKVGADVLTASADFSYDNMEIGNSKVITASNIVLDSGHMENSNYELAVTTISKAGASIRAVSSANEMKLVVDHLKTMIVDEHSLTPEEKELVTKAVIQLNQLPENQKKVLDLNTVLYLDKLQNRNIGNATNINITQTGPDVVSPITLTVQGATLAAGAVPGDVVEIDVTSQKSGDGSVKMELLLSMKKNGAEQSLLYPLLFTVNLPASIDSSKLKLLHVMTDRSEAVAFTNIGNQQITFTLSSFSKLLFMEKEVIVEKPDSSSGSSSGSNKKKSQVDTEEDKEYDFWQSVKRKLRKANDGEHLTVDAKKYQELPWYIMDVLRDRKTLRITIYWKGGKAFTIPEGKAQPSDEKMVYWPLKYLEEIYNKVETQPIIIPPIPAVEMPKAEPVKPKKVSVAEPATTEVKETAEEKSTIEEKPAMEESQVSSEETERETQAVISENVHQVNSFCLIDLLTGGLTNLGCYWCFIPIIIIVSIIGVMMIILQELSNKEDKK